jgi:sulfur-oxidizing protein SoxY
MTRMGLRLICTAAMAGAVIGFAQPSVAAPPEPDDPWPALAADVFPGRPLLDGTGLIDLDMPARAEDAAVVPVAMRLTLPAGDARQLRGLTLIIDQNPAPVAAAFRIGPGAGVTAVATRVRVNAYTNVHAVAELNDGQLYVVRTFVKASGGCGAPAAKTATEATASLGQMAFGPSATYAAASAPREAKLMMRHPNNSGLQRDQITHLYIPAQFVDELRLWQDAELIIAMESGIAISEDPSIRFTYRPNGARTIRAEARDTDGNRFTGAWPADAPPM